MLSCTESVWNTLHPCSFSRFWNTASCKDNEVLEGMAEKNSTFPSLSMALEHLRPEKQKERSAMEPIIRTLSDFVHNGIEEMLQITNDRLLNNDRKTPIAPPPSPSSACP